MAARLPIVDTPSAWRPTRSRIGVSALFVPQRDAATRSPRPSSELIRRPCAAGSNSATVRKKRRVTIVKPTACAQWADTLTSIDRVS